MATFLAMDIRQTQPGEAKPGQRSFLRWLARTYIPTWGTQEDELVERYTCDDGFASTEHNLNDALTSRGDMTFRL